ncbi:hypothetical protein EB834_18490 [Brevibacterium aurantiacum]|uniref:Uncharacterized protein n=1 Tax=Brevibacterium aurantiacum TaxID=273384 RepID=A0A4Z0KHP0_BREAU|nr:hypothetical protein EB834_18490 [Brevibacterium aurantiacum]
MNNDIDPTVGRPTGGAVSSDELDAVPPDRESINDAALSIVRMAKDGGAEQIRTKRWNASASAETNSKPRSMPGFTKFEHPRGHSLTSSMQAEGPCRWQ